MYSEWCIRQLGDLFPKDPFITQFENFTLPPVRFNSEFIYTIWATYTPSTGSAAVPFGYHQTSFIIQFHL